MNELVICKKVTKALILLITLLVLPFSVVSLRSVNTMKDTKISEECFMLTLPGSWYSVTKNPPNFYQYRSNNETENLSVSIYISKTQINENEASNMLDEFIKARLKSEKQVANSTNLKISNVIKEKQKDANIGFYSGFQPEANRRFATFIIVNEQLIAVFYYEVLDAPKDLFKQHLQQVIGHVSLKKLIHNL